MHFCAFPVVWLVSIAVHFCALLCIMFCFISAQGMSGFHFQGGGVNRAPQNGGGGVQEKGSIDRRH